MLPGSSAVPSCRNHAAPWRAMRATWARVSTFCTSVGAPPTPRSKVRGGLNVGMREAAVDAADQGGFLACEEPRRAGNEPDRPRVAAGGGPFGEREGEPFVQPAAGVHIQIDAAGADRGRGQLQPIEHEMRREPEQVLVLAARWLTLGAVTDHDGPPPLRGDRGHLPRCRECRAAPAGQACGRYLGDEAVACPAAAACARGSAAGRETAGDWARSPVAAPRAAWRQQPGERAGRSGPRL